MTIKELILILVVLLMICLLPCIAQWSVLDGKLYFQVPTVEKINSAHWNYAYGTYGGYAPVEEQMADDIKELAWRVQRLEQKQCR